MKRHYRPLPQFLFATTLFMSACAEDSTTKTPAPKTTPTPTFIAPEGALVSVTAATVPVLDGTADDAAWSDASATTIKVAGGFNNYQTEINLRSVYNGDTVYFVATWADPAESNVREPWEKKADGKWAKVKDPNDKGGDNNAIYEDKLAFIWPINNSIVNFQTQGCFALCHAGENSDKKPYGNKYTASDAEKGDIWHWKSVRNLGQLDDQYVDHTTYSTATPEAGRKSDKKDSGGYADNTTNVATSIPSFMAPGGGTKDGKPGFILESEKVALDNVLFATGDRVPSILKTAFLGDRGDFSAGWKWVNGNWTVEFSRKLVTGSATDVQFDNLESTYYFGVAAFNNAQVRHAFQTGATPFVFKP